MFPCPKRWVFSPRICSSAILALALFAYWFLEPQAKGNTVVQLGSITQLTGPADLDLEGEIVYAVNFSTDDPVRTVRGVRFLPDTQRIPGASFIGPQQVTPWQNKPEFGSTEEANQLEEILHDIRWANSGAGERLRATLAITNGFEYKLQLLISGNGSEDRRWDIRVGGKQAVDEITSLGSSPGQSYSIDRSTLYTYQFISTTNSLVIEMGNLFGANEGGDRNPIWQALTLERVFIPPTPDDLSLSPQKFFPTQTAFIGRFRVSDRKSGVKHALSLVSGEGDIDNSKFALVGSDLLPGNFDFQADPPGTVYSIRARAADPTDAPRILERIFTLTLEAAHAPSAVVLDATSINSSARPGSLLAKIRAADPDTFDRHRIELTPGPGDNDNALLAIVGEELRLITSLPSGLASLRTRMRAVDLSGLEVTTSFDLPILAARLRINELVASEVGGIPDEGSRPTEWIEIYNEQEHWAPLTGYFLSDQPSNPKRWQFPTSVVPPFGFLLVLADGLGTAPVGSALLHANFSLDASGGRVSLVAPDGTTPISELRATEFFPGVSFGISIDGLAGHLRNRTPGATNGSRSVFGENRVTFSKAHGFYSNHFDLFLSATVPDSEIRYTLDGTHPATNRSLIYTHPIVVLPNTNAIARGARIVRAMAFHTNAAYAPAATQTYLFINGDTTPTVDAVTNQSQLVTAISRNANYGPLMDDALLALPTVSLILPQGPTATERSASLELFDPSGKEDGFQIDCGIEATGTTSLGSPKLSMAARFRSAYGHSKLRYPVYAQGSMVPEGAATEFKELRLRSHSHDSFYWLATSENPPVPYGDPPVQRSGDAQLTRNPWIDEMQLLMGQPGKRARQVHLYLNGAYHGIYHIQEHPDDDFMASYLPGSADEYHFTSSVVGGSDHGSGDTWRTPWTALKASLVNYALAVRWIDVTNLCDYMTLSFYAGNDWDWSAQHNWSAAGPKSIDRGGWKFFQQDSDITLQDVAADCTDQDVPDGIFTALMAHPEFRSLFRDRVYYQCFNQGPLTPARAGGLYDARMREISTAIVAETARWQPSSSVSALPWDRNQEWTNEWNYLRTNYFPNRVPRLIAQLKRHKGWWPVDPPELGQVQGTVPLDFHLSFSTETAPVYFTTDGSDPRLTGGQLNPKAKRLEAAIHRTSLISTGAVWRFMDNGSDPGPSWNTEAFDDTSWKSGPTEIGYGDGDEATVAEFIDTDPVATGIQRNLTTYFRKRFDAPGVSQFQNLRLRLLRDDGAVVYLNGIPLIRTNLPAGAITFQTRATRDVQGTEEKAFSEYFFTLSQAPLLVSNNILAVEIHQRAPDNLDISFNLDLIGTEPDPKAFVVIDRPLLIRARAFATNDWSALVEAYLVPDTLPHASSASLLLSEIHFRPWDDTSNEFLEFVNTSDRTFDLSDVVVTQAVEFAFPRPTLLGVGEHIVVAKDPERFRARYQTNTSPYYREGIRVIGPWSGSLANEGETIRVVGHDGVNLFLCSYGTGGLWPFLANGRGSSLELISPHEVPTTRDAKSDWLSNPLNWRSTSEFHGTPGIQGQGDSSRIAINELIAAPFAPQPDAIELLNVSPLIVELGGWFLSDSSTTYKKYRFPNGTHLEPGGRIVLTEAQFNVSGGEGVIVPFAFDDAGDQVYLTEANQQADLLRIADWIQYGAIPRGTVVGRWPDGTGPVSWLASPTLGQPNARPIPGYTAWAAQQFPTSAPTNLTLEDADPDQDGISNRSEYAFALSPLHRDPSPLEVAGVDAEGRLSFRYRRRTEVAGLVYRVETSPDLQVWENSDSRVEEMATQERPDGATLVTARVALLSADARDRLFLRVVARP